MRLGGTSAALVASVLIVVGCGGSSSSTVTTPSTSSSTPSTAASATTALTTASTTSSTAPSFASAANCAQLLGLGAKFARTISTAASGGKFDLQAELNAYQALANAAPAEVRPDLQTLEQAFTSFLTALQKAGYKQGSVPTASQILAIQGALQSFNQPKLRAAEQRLSAWGRRNCG
jgi:hypothetical protein